jgi:hypothetical protein
MDLSFAEGRIQTGKEKESRYHHHLLVEHLEKKKRIFDSNEMSAWRLAHLVIENVSLHESVLGH